MPWKSQGCSLYFSSFLGWGLIRGAYNLLANFFKLCTLVVLVIRRVLIKGKGVLIIEGVKFWNKFSINCTYGVGDMGSNGEVELNGGFQNIFRGKNCTKISTWYHLSNKRYIILKSFMARFLFHVAARGIASQNNCVNFPNKQTKLHNWFFLKNP